jgi:hypothetical protein
VSEKDPILNNAEPARQLFHSFSQVSHGFSTIDVVNATLNMLINAVRQAEPTRKGASETWDEYVNRSKGLLMNSYDSTGRKKGIYPYTQTLTADLANFKMKRPR